MATSRSSKQTRCFWISDAGKSGLLGALCAPNRSHGVFGFACYSQKVCMLLAEVIIETLLLSIRAYTLPQ